MPIETLDAEFDHWCGALKTRAGTGNEEADMRFAYTAAAQDRDTYIKSLIVWRDELLQENFDLLTAIAPLLGLKPFYGTGNTQQVIWADSQEQASALSLGQSVFTFVKLALAESKAREQKG